MTEAYDYGQTVTVTGTFSDDIGYMDPTTVTLMVEEPDGTETTYTYALAQVTKDSVGHYSKNITMDAAGQWYCRWEGVTSGVKAVIEYWIFVKSSKFYP